MRVGNAVIRVSWCPFVVARPCPSFPCVPWATTRSESEEPPAVRPTISSAASSRSYIGNASSVSIRVQRRCARWWTLAVRTPTEEKRVLVAVGCHNFERLIGPSDGLNETPTKHLRLLFRKQPADAEKAT